MICFPVSQKDALTLCSMSNAANMIVFGNVHLSNAPTNCFPISSRAAIPEPSLFTPSSKKYVRIKKYIYIYKCMHFPVKSLSSQLTHCKLTWNLTASSCWSHSSTAQQTRKMRSHCELAVSYVWDQPMSSPCSGSSELTVIWSPVSSPCYLIVISLFTS